MHLFSANQPDAIAAHFTYVSRTSVGPAVLVVTEVKRGRATSVLHIALYQSDLTLLPSVGTGTATISSSTEIVQCGAPAVVAYLTQGSVALERGPSLPTGYQLQTAGPPLLPRPDFARLAAAGASEGAGDENWVFEPYPADSYRRALRNLVYFMPRRPQALPMPDADGGVGRIADDVNGGSGGKAQLVVDRWIRLSCGERFTGTSLGYVADSYPYVVESFRPPPGDGGESSPYADLFANGNFWYPTLVMNVETKKALPEAGVEWLFIRVTAKMIRNGRLDLEVLILDEMMDLVAVANHVNLILSSERNTSERNHGKSKI